MHMNNSSITIKLILDIYMNSYTYKYINTITTKCLKTKQHQRTTI